MKKFMTIAAVLAALTLTVTGCSNKDDSSNASTNEAAGSSTVEATVEAGNTDASTAEAGSTESDVTDAAPESALSAADMAANAFAAAEWPALMEIADAETANMLFGLDLSMVEEYVMYAPMMSAHLHELIILKPTAGNEEAVQAALDSHFAYIKDGAAFYPDQEITAAASVQGKTDNGYLYVIVHEDGAKIADSLLNNPPASADSNVEEDAASMALTLGEAAVNSVEWPAMMMVEDPELVLNFFGIDVNLCEDSYISNQMISAQLYEIIIVKPVAGSEDAIMQQMQSHFDYIKTDAAFYPDQEPCAEGAVMGQTPNGYLYILVHQDGSTVEAAVMEAANA